jgi:hypothetical protein
VRSVCSLFLEKLCFGTKFQLLDFGTCLPGRSARMRLRIDRRPRNSQPALTFGEPSRQFRMSAVTIAGVAGEGQAGPPPVRLIIAASFLHEAHQYSAGLQGVGIAAR